MRYFGEPKKRHQLDNSKIELVSAGCCWCDVTVMVPIDFCNGGGEFYCTKCFNLMKKGKDDMLIKRKRASARPMDVGDES